MDIAELTADSIETFVETLWVPAQREMAELEAYSLQSEIQEAGLEFIRDQVQGSDSVVYAARRDGSILGMSLLRSIHRPRWSSRYLNAT